MGIKLSNNASSRLAANLGISDTTIVLSAGGGAVFPALAAGDWFPATIVKMTGEFEIVKVTARAADTLTVQRGARYQLQGSAYSLNPDWNSSIWSIYTCRDHE